MRWLLSSEVAPSLSRHLLQTDRQTDHTGKLPSITAAMSIPLHTQIPHTSPSFSLISIWTSFIAFSQGNYDGMKTHLHLSSPALHPMMRDPVSLGFTVIILALHHSEKLIILKNELGFTINYNYRFREVCYFV